MEVVGDEDHNAPIPTQQLNVGNSNKHGEVEVIRNDDDDNINAPIPIEQLALAPEVHNGTDIPTRQVSVKCCGILKHETHVIDGANIPTRQVAVECNCTKEHLIHVIDGADIPT